MATEHSETFYRAVQGIKDAVKHQTPKNIEAILYTVEDHDAENREWRETGEVIRGFVEGLRLDKIYGLNRDQSFSQALEELKDAGIRGLTEQEREEFVREYT